MQWIEITVNTDPLFTEAVTAVVLDLGSNGVIDDNPGQIRAYFPADEYDEALVNERIIRALQDFLSGFPGGPFPIFTVSQQEVEEEDWATAWKQYYHATRIGERLVIVPSWEEYLPLEKDLVIKLDPGMAFGTGTHSSTSLALMLLEKYLQPGSLVLDLGTGSGILSIAARKLGAKRAIGLDIDPVAIRVAKENVAENSLNEIELYVSDIRDFQSVSEFDLVIANLTAGIILANGSEIAKFAKNLILSGIIVEKWPMVEEFFLSLGYRVREVHTENDWLAACLTREF